MAQGVTRFTFLMHHQASLIEEFIALQKSYGRMKDCELRISVEPSTDGNGWGYCLCAPSV